MSKEKEDVISRIKEDIGLLEVDELFDFTIELTSEEPADDNE